MFGIIVVSISFITFKIIKRKSQEKFVNHLIDPLKSADQKPNFPSSLLKSYQGFGKKYFRFQPFSALNFSHLKAFIDSFDTFLSKLNSFFHMIPSETQLNDQYKDSIKTYGQSVFLSTLAHFP